MLIFDELRSCILLILLLREIFDAYLAEIEVLSIDVNSLKHQLNLRQKQLFVIIDLVLLLLDKTV